MKKFITLLFLIISSFVFSQQKQNIDTSVICLPTEIGRKILKDLNELDKLKETSVLTEKEIKELENKISKQDSVILILNEKDKINLSIIKSTEEKYKLLEEDNKDLRKRNKILKIKNNVIEIATGVLLATITCIQIFR